MFDFRRARAGTRHIGLGGLALTAAGCMAQPGPPSANPLFAGADPAALVVDGELWVFPTNGGPTGRADRLLAWLSSDLATWRPRATLIRRDAISWIGDDGAPRHHLWAPDMVRAGGRYYLYYSVGPQNPTPSRIGVAVGDSPQGPFTDSGRPLLTGGNGFEAIDPMVFIDPASGVRYLYAGGSAGATLRAFVLKPDMVTIDREVTITQPRNFTEAPFMHARDGIYYLSYSFGSWRDATYSVHYSTAPSPIGPWRYRGAILESDARYTGPGHHSFVRHPESGEWLIVYHRWEHPPGERRPGGGRQIAIERIDYDPDGAIRPTVMTGR